MIKNEKILRTYRSQNAILAQPKNCVFGVNIMIELRNIRKASDNAGTIVS